MISALEHRRQLVAQARFYAILDMGYVTAHQAPYLTEQLIYGGVDLIQLRAKKLSEDAVVKLAKEIRQIIPTQGPIFVLNDHPHLAAEVKAFGVHVGQDDISVAEARAAAGPDVLVGKSTHSLEQAIAAEKEGADYIGVGPIFATPTKPDYIPVGPALIGQVRGAVKVPQFCIGGIKEKNLPEVIAAGARRVVIVSEVLQTIDVQAYCRRVRAQLEQAPF